MKQESLTVRKETWNICESGLCMLEWALQMITLHNSMLLSNPFNLELVRDCEGTLEKWSESDPGMVMVMSPIVIGPCAQLQWAN